MITLINEDQLLDIKFRQDAIEQIQSDGNQERKKKKLKAYEIYKDMTKKWVIEAISKEFSEKTVEQMMNRAANISVARKINDKKAKSYSGGVIREIPDEPENTEKLGQLVEFLSFDSIMKKADRFSELLKNVEIQTLYQNDSVEELAPGNPKKTLTNRIMLPHQYDPIVHAHDKCKPVAFVLSDFYDTKSLILNDLLSDYVGTRDRHQPLANRQAGALPANDKPSIYIWWSAKYHFTTDDKGNILQQMSPEGLSNPIDMLTFTSVHADQDDGYWCEGGNDLIDGAVLINVLITDLFSIMNVQGWGQLVITGKKIPASIMGGPHRALTFEYDEGDPNPKVEYVSSNPPIDEWRQCITMYVALLLSTNGLSTNNLSTTLEGGSSNIASGVAMMLDSAESTESVEDKQKMFQKAESEVWKKNFATQNYLFQNGVAVDALKEIGEIKTGKPVKVKFHQTKSIMTETEKVEILKKKKDSGLYEVAELLMIKNPDLKPEEAEEKALKLLEDRIKYSVLYQAGVNGIVNDLNRNLQNGDIDEEFEQAPNASGASGGEGNT